MMETFLKISLLLLLLLNVDDCSSHTIKTSCMTTSFEKFPCPIDEESVAADDVGDQMKIKLDEKHSDWLCYGYYFDTANVSGWDELQMVSNEKISDEDQAYCIGYNEGEVTADQINNFMENILDGDECDKFGPFLKKHFDNLFEKAQKNSDTDPYWRQIYLSILHIAGIDDGFHYYYPNRSTTAKSNREKIIQRNYYNIEIDPCSSFLLNVYYELDDLKYLLGLPPTEHPQSRCSALIKLLPNNKDVVISHNAWANPKTMNRIVKQYELPYGSSKAITYSMSSYPAFITSMDDFIITDQQLVITETTIENFNKDLYKKVDVDDMVFQFLRNSVATRLAKSGEEWANIFALHNSGTYNNQYMIIDYKKFQPDSAKIDPGFLWILEQLPSYVEIAEKTDELLKKTYWPSYNIPYFNSTFKLAGYNEMVQKFGDHYTYDKNGRALIFERDHIKVTNMTTLYHLMRYNDFKNDPLSKCNCTPPYTADRAIAARNDLNDPNGKYPLYDFGFHPTMAIDVKMTNYNLTQNLIMIMEGGPTTQNEPPFDWSTTKLSNLKHQGQPIVWNFNPIVANYSYIPNIFPEWDFNC